MVTSDDCNGGTGCDTTLGVEDAGYFFDGWGISANVPAATIEVDGICVGTVSNCVQISSIDYAADMITLASLLNRNDVWLYKDAFGDIVLYGSGPDQGAHEYFDGPANTGGSSDGGGGGFFGVSPVKR